MKTYAVEVNSEHVNSLNLDDNEYITRRFAIECAERAFCVFEAGYLSEDTILRAIDMARRFVEQHKDSLDSISLFDYTANDLMKLSEEAWKAAWMWAAFGPKRYAAETAAFAAAIHLPANIAARSAAASAIAAIAERARMKAMGKGAKAAFKAKQHAREAEEAWQVTRLQQLRWEAKEAH